MNYKTSTITKLVSDLGAREATNIVCLAKKQNALEKKWIKKLKNRFDEIGKQVFSQLIESGEFDPSLIDVRDIIMESSLETMALAVKSTENHLLPKSVAKLTAPPKAAIPRTLKEIRKLWDRYYQGRLPARQKKHADSIAKAYLKQVQSVWFKYSKNFRAGITADKTEMIQGMMKEAQIGFTRGKMIVQTETTYFYDRVRSEIYDQADSVTHYLFIALRDHATTAWCRTRQGIVYDKQDLITKKEAPPCHWNCRSERVPLTPSNPNHARLIKDKSRARRNRNPEPLPPEWNKVARPEKTKNKK